MDKPQCGALYVERMIPVRIKCSENQINAIADLTAKKYSQLAVMYYLVSEKVVIKHYSHPTPKRRKQE